MEWPGFNDECAIEQHQCQPICEAVAVMISARGMAARAKPATVAGQ
jgi:hypothetical protein